MVNFSPIAFYNTFNLIFIIDTLNVQKEKKMNHFIQEVIQEYSRLFISGILLLLFQNTIKEAVDGIMIFLGNDYNEDDVVEVDGSPGRIVRVGIWKTVFFIYHVIDGRIVGGSKLVVTNSKLKDLKIEKPLPNLDLSKYTPK